MDTAGGRTNSEMRQGRGQERKHAVIVQAGRETNVGHSLLFFWHAKRDFWTGKCVGHILFVVGTDLRDTTIISNPAEPCKT